MSNDYVGLADLQDSPEDLPEEIESADYVNYDLIFPGNYLSQSRVITAKKKDDGSIVFCLAFPSGLTNVETGETFAVKSNYPERTWISTKQYQKQGRVGKTSGVADYLRACGLSPKGGDYVALMQESVNIPVMVYVAWEDKTEKAADGTYPESVLKTKDFNVGTKEDPQYTPVVEKDGVTYQARHKVTSNFSQVRG